MILVIRNHDVNRVGKPRASGDDPDPQTALRENLDVNPARAGMIRSVRVAYVDGVP